MPTNFKGRRTEEESFLFLKRLQNNNIIIETDTNFSQADRFLIKKFKKALNFNTLASI